MTFAANTVVAVEKTQTEIRKMVLGAGGQSFATFEESGIAMIAFRLGERNIRFKISVPKASQNERQADTKRREQVTRSKWRSLFLVIKAKLESVASKIETLEEAFLAHTVMPGGRTVMEEISAPLALSYQNRTDIPLLPSP